MARRRRFDDETIAGLKVRPRRYDAPDPAVPGLFVRVSPLGHKSFAFYTRFPGRPHPTRRALGEVGAITLEAARARARRWIGWIRQGLDPEEAEREEKLAAARQEKRTFASVAEEYIEHIKRVGQRKADVVERNIRNALLPEWAGRRIETITAQDVAAVVRSRASRGVRKKGGAPRMAHNLFDNIRSLFSWAVPVYLDQSPCERLRPTKLIGPKKPRTRVLTDRELRGFWAAAEAMPYPYGPLYRMLAMTGQRKSEVAEARWREFDLDKAVWSIPPERMKMDHPHVVPLAPAMVDLLRALPRFAKHDHLFSTTLGMKPVNGFSKNKTRLDRRVLAELRKDDPAARLEPFVIHDIRRTMRTHLSGLPIPENVRELVIAHAKPGLHKVYDQHAYQDEKREALTLWGARLRSIVEPPPANVVPMKKKGRRS